jgi:hypothetical protein
MSSHKCDACDWPMLTNAQMCPDVAALLAMYQHRHP